MGEIPRVLALGVPMLKMSSKKIKQVVIRLLDNSITWEGRNNSEGRSCNAFSFGGFLKEVAVPISQIRELRLNAPPMETDNTSRWITIVYVRATQWKVLHMIALTEDIYDLWVDTLKRLVAETSDRLVSQITPSDPDSLWIRQLWPAGVKTIDFATASRLCGQIGLSLPHEAERRYDVRN